MSLFDFLFLYCLLYRDEYTDCASTIAGIYGTANLPMIFCSLSSGLSIDIGSFRFTRATITIVGDNKHS